MNIKSSQNLVDEALKTIETLNATEVKKLAENNVITLIDVRDIREIWKEGTVENSKHIPRGMLEFWLDQRALTINHTKLKILKKWFYFVHLDLGLHWQQNHW